MHKTEIDEIERLVKSRMDFINKNKEKLIEAWVAETGYLPSESMLMEQREATTCKIWVEKKYPHLPKNEYPKMDKMIAKLKAAEKLADAIDVLKKDWDSDDYWSDEKHVVDSLEAYRKAGESE
jgi:hypothetical protein